MQKSFVTLNACTMRVDGCSRICMSISALCESSTMPQPLTYMDDGISNSGWYTPENFKSELSHCTYATSALARDLLREKIYRRFTSHFAYKQDKTLLAFRGKCHQSRSRRTHDKQRQLNILRDAVKKLFLFRRTWNRVARSRKSTYCFFVIIIM